MFKIEKYKTGTGQIIGVHDKEKCKGEYCCIHNPSDHKMKDWPTHWRDDRQLMERICKCGVGHPDPDDLAFKSRLDCFSDRDIEVEAVHGCCGCCMEEKEK